jgi:hypothetical protein
MVGTEGVGVFVLGEVDGLQEGLGEVGDGAGGSGFYIAADDCGDEASQGGAEIAGGEVVAGEEVRQVFAERLGGAGPGFFLGVVGAEAGIVAEARSAAMAAIREGKRTQGHAVLCTERGHKSLLRVEFWDCCRSKSENRKWKIENRKTRAGPSRLRAGRRYKHGPKTETPRLEPGRTFQQGYCTMRVMQVNLKLWAKERKVKTRMRSAGEERFLSAQADRFARAKREEKVGLLRSK